MKSEHDTRRTTQGGQLSYSRFFGYALIAVAVACVPILLWQLADLLLLAFGAVLIACLLKVVAEPFQRWTSLPEWFALLISGILVMAVFLSAVWIFGAQLGAEFSDVTRRIESASSVIEALLRQNEAGKYLLDQVQGTDLSLTIMLRKAFSLGTSGVEAMIVVAISAIYLVVQPKIYRRGLVLLFPPGMRERIDVALGEMGRALRLWIIGQMIQMAIIGTLSTIAVWLIGLPSVLALGLIATVTEFVPYLGRSPPRSRPSSSL